MGSHRRNPVCAVSLKMYFERARTLQYAARVRYLLSQEPGLDGIVTLALLPDFLALPATVDELQGSGVLVGAQDLAPAVRGAYTGEVSGADLFDVGARLVEIGHAERRTIFREDAELIAAKVGAAVDCDLVPLLCIGEAERTTAPLAAEECVAQVRSALADRCPRALWLAYEPHWAIGADEPATPDHVSAVCEIIRTDLADLPDVTVLYGGSAGPGLINQLSSAVDGLFLGRFAHEPEAFVAVAKETMG